MIKMRKSLRNLSLARRQWEKMVEAGMSMDAALGGAPVGAHLREVTDFGSNPGALRMFVYEPPDLAKNCPLVVVLHGCSQTAAGYDLGAGWSTIAERYGFAVLLPEQQRANNPNNCFDWFQGGDIERGQGEALSIRQMIAKMVTDHGVDQRRIFVTGLSAGGAMASVMLATYPEVFAGGGIVAGLPYGAATNVQEAFQSMYQSPKRPADEWGELVRQASTYRGPWPRISVWHGSADTTVIPANAAEIVKQWTDLHGLSETPTLTETVDGYPRQVWRSAAGEDVIESYLIPNMAHGTPLAVGSEEWQCGAAGAFLLDVGISSSFHIAKFWGLTGHARSKSVVERLQIFNTPEERPDKRRPERVAEPAGAGAPVIDIKATITQALRAAGLMKTE